MNEAILVIDDEKLVRESLMRQLALAGYVCTGAADAAEAREKLGESRFDLVVCDVGMPGETGLGLTAFIKERYPHTPVVIVSAVGDPLIEDAIAAVGAASYLAKPYDQDELLRTMAKTLHAAKRVS